LTIKDVDTPTLQPRSPVRLSLMLLVYLPVLGGAVLWSWLAGTLDGWWGRPGALWLDLLIGSGVGLAIVGLSNLTVTLVPAFGRLAARLAEVIGPLTWRMVIVAAVLSAVAEESLFRGAMQASWGLLVACAVFAACHVGPERTFLAWTVFAAVAGLALGGLFAWREGLAAPIAAHLVTNGINLWLLSRRARRTTIR
jgi:hypothetical protein